MIDSLSSVNTHVQKGHYIYSSFIEKHARPNIEYIKIKNSKTVCVLWKPAKVYRILFVLSSSYIPEFQLESKERRSIGVIGNISKTWMSKKEFHFWYLFCDWVIDKLNSGIFCSFDPREWNLNLNSSDCRALKSIKTIPNPDQFPENWKWKIHIKTFAWAFWASNPTLSSNFSHRSKGAHKYYKFL